MSIIQSFIGTILANTFSFVLLAVIIKAMSGRIKNKVDKEVEKKKQEAIGGIFDVEN